jgi:hypothetical protein
MRIALHPLTQITVPLFHVTPCVKAQNEVACVYGEAKEEDGVCLACPAGHLNIDSTGVAKARRGETERGD